MPPKLQRRFDVVESQRATLQSRIPALSDAQLNWKPNADTWSIRQIIQHLVLSDETVGRAHAGEVKGTEAIMFRIMPRAWRRALVLNAFKRNMILPLPSPDVEPHEDVPLSELLSRWEIARSDMNRILNTLRGDEKRYSHPVLGPLTATQMLDLEQSHTAYHARQIEALQDNSKFPRL